MGGHLAKKNLLFVLITGFLAGGVVHSQDDAGPSRERMVYVVGFVKPGPQWKADRNAGLTKLLQGHQKYLEWLTEKEKVVAAGTVESDSLRGVVIMKVDSLDEAKKFLERDPTIQSGHYRIDWFSWWGPAGLGEEYLARVKSFPDAVPDTVHYQLGIVRKGDGTGSTTETDPEFVHRQHKAYVAKLFQNGDLVAIGSFSSSKKLIGLFIYKTSPENARILVANDPSVKVGRIAVDLFSWSLPKGVLPTRRSSKQ